MIKFYVGFKFVDNMWGTDAIGEIVAQRKDGRWEIRWSDMPDHTFDSNKGITAMIRGYM